MMAKVNKSLHAVDIKTADNETEKIILKFVFCPKEL